jgi:hypothetical protein
MTHGPEYLKAEAIKAAAHQLKKAATFTALHAKNPLFQKRMGKGSTSVWVRIEFPGSLLVIDPDSGEIMAASEPGRPDVLRFGFMPPVPALAGAGSGGNLQGGR